MNNAYYHIIRTLSSILIFVFLAVAGKTQIKSIGTPHIRNYTQREYNASTQNWAAIQDKRGILYFANNNGLLEFDGVHWRLLQMPNTSVVRSIATDKSGTIYIGAFGEFGYLKPTDNGKFQYVSLVGLVPEYVRNFGDIWKIYDTDNGVIFQSFTAIFLYKNKKISVLAQERDFHFSFYVNEELYITERKKGLLRLKDEKLIPVNGGDIFNNNIWSMLPFNDHKILIATSDHGLYVLENDQVKKWDVTVNDFLMQNQVYCATKIKDFFAIGTILNGLLILDQKGNPVQHINREKGLQNNTVLSVYADNYDNLWVGLDNGIDYVETNSPFTSIVNKSKIGAGYVSYIFDEKLYLGTNQGLFYKEWEYPGNPFKNQDEFKMVENTQGQVWDLFEYNNTLFCGHNNGTYIIHDNKAELISDVMGGWLLFHFPDQKNTLLEGTYTGLIKFETNNERWKTSKIDGFNESCRTIETYLGKDDYTLWISHGYKGIFKLVLNRDLNKILSIDFFDSSNGLKTDLGNTVLRFNDEIIFTNSTGIYKFDQDQKAFIPHTELNNLFGNNGAVREIAKDQSSNYWFIQGEGMGVVKKLNDGNYKINRTIFKSFAGNFVGGFEHLNPYNNNSVIIATEEGFAHFTTDFIKDIEIPFNTLIRSVEANDSLLFGGVYSDSSGKMLVNQPIEQIKKMPYKCNDIKIEYSATHYENTNSIKYTFLLEGYDDMWSEWTEKTFKEYTNLKEGEYTFKIKAKNVYDQETEIASFSFIINPPWYRSVLAYIIYILLIIVFSFILINIVKKRIEHEKRMLRLKQKRELHEQKINHENEVLSAQQEIAKLRNEKLRIENEKNKAEVELKTKELASYAMQVTQKNESLFDIKEQLKHISQKVNPDAQKYLQKLIKRIEQNTNQKEDWERFEKYFDQVYEDFTKRIREKYPNLTPNDVKLCAYLRMNLSSKEIAPLLNISVRGVEVSRYRLRKKLHLPQNENLIDFMMNL